MANSMTGYGRARIERDGREMLVELKSVNHRFLDVSMRLPRPVSFLEESIRTALSAKLARGHVDVFLTYRNTRPDAKVVTLDSALLGAYAAAAEQARVLTGLNSVPLESLLRYSDVLTVVEAEEDQQALKDLCGECVRMALVELCAMRAAEGGRLAADMAERMGAVAGLAAQIFGRAPLVVDEYRVKLAARLDKLLTPAACAQPMDEARLATEVAVFADRACIDEELTRLASHNEQFLVTLAANEPAGRKLDFIVQEINREFNTIGSKAGDAAIAGAVIAAKCEVEKLREQLQNIE